MFKYFFEQTKVIDSFYSDNRKKPAHKVVRSKLAGVISAIFLTCSGSSVALAHGGHNNILETSGWTEHQTRPLSNQMNINNGHHHVHEHFNSSQDIALNNWNSAPQQLRSQIKKDLETEIMLLNSKSPLMDSYDQVMGRYNEERAFSFNDRDGTKAINTKIKTLREMKRAGLLQDLFTVLKTRWSLDNPLIQEQGHTGSVYNQGYSHHNNNSQSSLNRWNKAPEGLKSEIKQNLETEIMLLDSNKPLIDAYNQTLSKYNEERAFVPDNTEESSKFQRKVDVLKSMKSSGVLREFFTVLKTQWLLDNPYGYRNQKNIKPHYKVPYQHR